MRTCLIVGAGISGLMAARVLTENKFRVTVLEKSRGVGGRLATRRIGDAVFDHGAQFITARSDLFREHIGSMLRAEVVREWCRGFPPEKSDGHPRYIGIKGMTGIAKYLARGLEVRLNERALFLSFRDGKWHVLTEKDETIEAEAVIITAPVPQTLALIQTAQLDRLKLFEEELSAIHYDRCLALLVTMEANHVLEPPGGLQLSGEPLAWIADNRMKGISEGTSALTIHAGPEFSRKYWEMDDKWIGQNILHTAAGWLRAKHLSFQVKRWLYSQPRIIYDDRFFARYEPAPVIAAGDAFGGPRVEGAALSGIAAAHALISHFS